MSFTFQVLRTVHWFILPFLLLWMAVAPSNLTPDCLLQARAALSDKFSGSYFGGSRIIDAT